MFSNRWIAYFDILGFSALVERAPHPDFILEIYNEALALSRQGAISDLVIADEAGGLPALASKCRELLCESLIPAKIFERHAGLSKSA